jgi:hypothetical protein
MPHSLRVSLTGPRWYGHGFSSISSKTPEPPSGGAQGFLRSAVATRGSLRDCLAFFFFLELWLEPPSSVFSCRFSFSLVSWKIAPTAFSSEAKLVAMSRSSLVVRGPLRPTHG